MKHLFIFLILCLLMPFNKASAQAKIPDFVLADVKGQYHHINKTVIKKQVLLICFMPDCEDCRAFTAKLTSHNELFNHYQVIMVTNSNLTVLKNFIVEFKLDKKIGLIIGTEGWTATLQRQLGVEHFPFVALYNAKGVLIRNFNDPNRLFDQTL